MPVGQPWAARCMDEAEQARTGAGVAGVLGWLHSRECS